MQVILDVNVLGESKKHCDVGRLPHCHNCYSKIKTLIFKFVTLTIALSGTKRA